MELYCKDTGKYIELADANFSIEATNQLQDLENYTVANSYDVKIINNETNANIVNGTIHKTTVRKYLPTLKQWVELEEYVNTYTILLMNNNTPLLTGRLVYQGSDTDTITCVYQAVPYSDMFAGFVFREKLSDYFEPSFDSITPNEQLYTFLEYGASNSSSFHISAKNGESAKVTTYNNHSNNWNFEKHDLANNYRVAMDTKEKFVVEPYASSRDFQRYFSSVNVVEFLRCLGIVVDDTTAVGEKLQYLFPMKFSINKKYKVRFYYAGATVTYVDDSESKAIKTVTKYAYANYKADQFSEIWVWNDYTQVWETGTEFEYWANYIQWGDFRGSIRSNLTLKDLTVEDVDFKSDYSIDLCQLNSSKMEQSMLFGLSKGKAYEEDGKDLTIKVLVSNFDGNNVQDQLNMLPDYVDVIFSLDVEKDFNSYPKDWGTWKSTNSYWARVPVQATDLSFLDMSTNEFLNYLSLNCNEFKFLRNPLFISIDNYSEIWNGTGGTSQYDFLTDADVISMSKSVDESSPSDLRITLPTYYSTSFVKHLNDRGNEEKEIKVCAPSICYQNTPSGFEDDRRSYPPLVFCDYEDERAEKYKFGDLVGVFGYWESKILTDIKGKPQVWNFFDNTSDFDYADEYQDHSETYTLKCTGYKLHEKIKLNSTSYAVKSYKTDDFCVFELQLLKIKD